MSEAKTASVAQYAKMHRVSEQTIRNAVAQGLIIMPTSGRIDIDQADASWAIQRRSRMTTQQTDQGRRSAEAKIVVGIAKLRLAKDKLEGVRERYINRAEFAAQANAEVQQFIVWLREIPDRCTAEFAAVLEISPTVAHQLLARFIDLCIVELGDLAEEAVRTAETA
jgi:hypothetical protein